MPRPTGAPRRQVLSPKQLLFVEEYLVDLNATQAALRAGYSEKTARSQGQRQLTKVAITAAIEKAQDARSKRVEITQDAVLRKIAQLAFTDLDAIATWEGKEIKIVASTDIAREHMGAIQEIAETKEGLRIKLADKLPALTLLARHLGLLPLIAAKVELTGPDGGPIKHEVKHSVDYNDYEGAFRTLLESGGPKRLPAPSGNHTGEPLDSLDAQP